MRRGATLLELALVLAVMGLMLAIALPPLRGLADGLAVHRAALDIVSAHRRARISAILTSQVIELTVDPNGLAIRPRGAAELWRTAGPAASQVALAGPARTITFSPVGLSMGLSNASFRLSRGGATRTVVVSRLGRVRVTP